MSYERKDYNLGITVDYDKSFDTGMDFSLYIPRHGLYRGSSRVFIFLMEHCSKTQLLNKVWDVNEGPRDVKKSDYSRMTKAQLAAMCTEWVSYSGIVSHTHPATEQVCYVQEDQEVSCPSLCPCTATGRICNYHAGYLG